MRAFYTAFGAHRPAGAPSDFRSPASKETDPGGGNFGSLAVE
jgi:hypothetical protein